MAGWPVQAMGAALLGVCAFAGCSRSHTASFEPIRFEQWQRQLQLMKGNIVVVDVWATWCAPCLERFPHMVELSRSYKGQDVEFVSINVDDREDKATIEKARQFVLQQNANFRNYLMNENILQSFENLGVQGIPAVLLYDRAGRLRYNLNGDNPNHQATLKDVDDALATLVAENHD